jgi:hypothetical protein
MAAPLAPDWLPEFEQAWKVFLARDVGHALMERLRAIEYHVALAACKAGSAHAAGSALGWTECRQWLESISRSSARQSDGPSRAGADLAQTESQNLLDTQPLGEAELCERLSP